MPDLQHLRLVRLPEQLERRKRPGFGTRIRRDIGAHAALVRDQLNGAVQTQQRRRPTAFVDPALILRVRVLGAVAEEDWDRLGLTVLSRDDDKSLVLFSSDAELGRFRERIAAYERGAPPGQAGAPYEAFISGIDSVSSVEPVDRIGHRLRAEGYLRADDFVGVELVSVDIEVWHIGQHALRLAKVEQLSRFIATLQGEAVDSYVGPSLTLVRASVPRGAIAQILQVEEVSSVDLPPKPDLVTDEILDLNLEDLPEVQDAGGDLPVIGVLDSGLTLNPLIEDAVVGVIGVPDDLGAADDLGHGTRVAGVAVFGDIRSQLEAGQLVRGARVCSAKVVNARGDFDDRSLVSTQMRRAISAMSSRFGARVFVISLCDRHSVYAGGKVGPWAATLDELARELNIVIVVAAGNRAPRTGNNLEEAVTAYPNYLLESANRLYEPGAAANVVTVGSIAHANGLDGDAAADVRVRSITERFEPSPFTRIGPGVGNGLKPDFVDIGGTMVFDPVVMRLLQGKDLATAGVLSLNNLIGRQLLVSASGTSYSAPMVAFKAAQLLRVLPTASSNLVRALLANAATIPAEALVRLNAIDQEKVRDVCGRGLVDQRRAAYSDENRVVLVAEDEISLDHFAIYEVPVPTEFQAERGTRSIRVTLAYDPPVRHTRADYVGVSMNFRLFRGCEVARLFEHFRKRAQAEGPVPEIETRFGCALVPGPVARERSTLQSAAVVYKRDVSTYGDRYYLVVRCERGWAPEDIQSQRFAVTVELTHSAEIRLHERLRVRINA